jgi:chloramphenicol 3-O-phosphotransferase
MALFNVSVRAHLSETTVDDLISTGVYFMQGAVDEEGSTRRRHHLRVQADNCDDAVERARQKLEDAGGDATLVECGGPVYT